MTLRTTILIMSAFGVISDSILIAFYPQFFELRYGLTSSVHVGAYIAAISIAVMCMLPFWARVARRVETMHLLAYTQLAATTFCLLAIWAPTVEAYWLLTMLMFMTKASYLLMFPYLMRLEPADRHSVTIGLLSVVVHIGAIFGAAVGGLALQEFGPRFCVALMAAGDLAQFGLCTYLIRSGRVVRVLSSDETERSAPAPRRTPEALAALLKLSLLMFLFDFSAYLVRPFFTVYWEARTGIAEQMLTGLVFAIPGIVALLALAVRYRIASPPRWVDHTLLNLLLGAVGLALQASPSPWLIIVAQTLHAFTFGTYHAAAVSLIHQHFQGRHQARGQALYTSISYGIGGALGGLASGLTWDSLGSTWTFTLAALSAALAWGVYAIWGDTKTVPAEAKL